MRGEGGCDTYWHSAPARLYRVTFLAGTERQWIDEEAFSLCAECVNDYVKRGHKVEPWKQKTQQTDSQLELSL